MNRTQSTLYQKSTKSKNVSFDTNAAEVEPEPVKLSPKVSTIESKSVDSVRVAEVEDTIDSVKVCEVEKTAEKSNESDLKSVRVKDDETTLINDSVASSTASFAVNWFPRNMKEFKKLSRDQKKELLQGTFLLIYNQINDF